MEMTPNIMFLAALPKPITDTNGMKESQFRMMAITALVRSGPVLGVGPDGRVAIKTGNRAVPFVVVIPLVVLLLHCGPYLSDVMLRFICKQ